MLSTSVTTKNRRAGSDLLRNNSSSGRICTLLNSNPEPTKNEDVQNISSGSTRRFKSDKIRRAFSSEYSIRKPVSDSLHMTFVRQSNEHDMCLSTGYVPSYDFFIFKIVTLPRFYPLSSYREKFSSDLGCTAC